MKKIFILVFVFLILGLISFPAIGAGFPYWGPVMSCNTPTTHRCSSLCDLLATLQNALYLGITIAMFIVAPIFFLVGGFYMIISQGDESKVKKGRKIITSTVWGIVIILTAFIIVNTIFIIIGPKVGGGKFNWSEIQCNPRELPGTVEWQ